MKTTWMVNAVMVALAYFGTQCGHSQGTFQNLNFESPILPLIPDGDFSVPIGDALPNWTGYVNGSPVTRVDYNSSSLSGPSVSLISTEALFYPPPIQGSYSVYLAAGAGLGQTGQVPGGAASVTFLIAPGSALTVSFEGQNIPLVQFGTSGNNTIMAGNISSFAGQTGELLFRGGGLFDAIQFSTSAIPEPSVLGLLVLGAVVSSWRSLRARRFSISASAHPAKKTLA